MQLQTSKTSISKLLKSAQILVNEISKQKNLQKYILSI